MIYILNVFIIILLNIAIPKRKNYKRNFVILSFLVMFLISGLRASTVGTDTGSYVKVYENYQSSEYYSYLFTHYEFGFKWLYYVLTFLHMPSQILIILISAVTLFNFGRFIYKSSKDVFLGTVIFACLFFPNSLNIIRQYLALSFMVSFMSYFFEKKYVKAILCVAIAVLFHTASILFVAPFVIYGIQKRFPKSKNIIIIAFFGLYAVTFIFGDKINEFILSIAQDGYYADKYQTARLIRMTTVLCVGYLIAVVYLCKYCKYSGLYTYFAAMGLFFSILYLQNEIYSRFVEIFNIMLIVSIPNGITHVEKKSRMPLSIIICSGVIVLMCIFVFTGSAGIANYKFFFQG